MTMRILLAHNSLYYPSFGGGDKSNRLLMEALAARGHDVRVVARVEHFGADAHEHLLAQLGARGVTVDASQGASIRFRLNGVHVSVLTRDSMLRAFFSAEMRAIDPDVIIASTDDPAHLMLDTALRSPRARVVYLVRATIALPFGPDSSFPSPTKTADLRHADGAVAVSEYVAEYARKWGGMDAVHVPISLLEPGGFPCVGRFENRFVTMVNPCAVKGIAIFLGLAEAFPQVEFAAVPTWGTTGDDLDALRLHPNISILPPVDDIGEVMCQTRVALVPSLWAEARSRIILEAMARGIPVMASATGGLAEAMLGMDHLLPVNPVVRYRAQVDALMVPAAEIPAQDVGPWVAVLRRLLTDRAHYDRVSAASRQAALAYAANLNALPFEAYLQKLVESPEQRAAPAPKSRKARLSTDRQKLLARRLKLQQANAEAHAALPGVDMEILWDGMWVRRVGPHYFPDPDMFGPGGPRWERWAAQAGKHVRDADDYWFHVYKPRPGDVIVDIGAGRGEDVFAFSRAVGPAGRVYAIEPHPVSFQALEKLCTLNGLTNVTRLNYACVDEPASLQIETLPIWESNYVRTGQATATSYPVEGVTFDSLCRRHGIDRIDFLKMNIEGAERRALPGCREALGRARSVCIAAHDFRAARGEGEDFRTLAFVREFLTAAGFRLVTRDDDPRYYVPYHVHGTR
jgi:FkbM family methyltransferase